MTQVVASLAVNLIDSPAGESLLKKTVLSAALREILRNLRVRSSFIALASLPLSIDSAEAQQGWHAF